MIDKKIFKKMVGDVFKMAGFSHKGQSFYLEGTDSVIVVNLQKSDFDEKYYINFGIWLKALGAAVLPKENHCHIQARLDSVFIEYISVIEDGCLLDKGSYDALLKLVEFLHNQVIPFCNESLNKENLKMKFVAGCFKGGLVMKAAADFLSNS